MNNREGGTSNIKIRINQSHILSRSFRKLKISKFLKFIMHLFYKTRIILPRIRDDKISLHLITRCTI